MEFAVGWRGSLLAVTLVTGPAATSARDRPPEPGLPIEAPRAPQAIPVVAWDHRVSTNLDAVHWTAPRDESVERLADRWGMKTSLLRKLNPSLGHEVEQDDWLLVYRRPTHDGDYAHAIGTPNHGRMEYAVAFPEGDHWRLRDWRQRAYGTDIAVSTLMSVFDAFGRMYPGTPPIMVGELSNRHGGRARPHSSHQSGHDADIGYVAAGEIPPHGRWLRPTKDTFDAEKNWVLIRSLLATGHVERVFVDAKLQRLMLAAAKQELEEDQLGTFFSVAAKGRRAASKAFIGHWKGHDDHMHVRFRCTPADVRCNSASAPKRRRRTKKAKKR